MNSHDFIAIGGSTGALDDGAAGLAAIKRCGGITVAQDPADAEADSMPLSALSGCDVDYRALLGLWRKCARNWRGQMGSEPSA